MSMESSAYEFRGNKMRENPLEPYISGLYDRTLFAATSDLAKQVEELKKQLEELKEKLDNAVTADEFEALAKAAIEKVLETEDFLKEYLKKAEADSKYATKTELALKADKASLDKKADRSELANYVIESLTTAIGTARIYNQEDGGGAMFIGTDGTVGRVTVNDGSSDNIWVQMASHNQDKSKVVRLNANPDGIYYTKNAEDKSAFTEDDELLTKKDIKALEVDPSNLATKDDLNNYVEKVIKNGDDVAYMANEKNGGLIKLTKADGTEAKITLFDGSDEGHTYIQLVADNKELDKIARINMTLDGAFYSAEKGEITLDNEIATKGDLKKIEVGEIPSLDGYLKKEELPAQLEPYAKQEAVDLKADKTELEKYVLTDVAGVDGASGIYNTEDGATISYVSSTGAKSEVNISKGESTNIYTQLVAKNADGSKKTFIQNNPEGAYYVKDKDANNFTEDDEIVTKKDIKDIGIDTSGLATKEDLLEKADKTEIADMVHADELSNYVVKSVNTTYGKSLIVNESNGSALKIVKDAGGTAGINIVEEDTLNARLYAKNAEGDKAVRVSVTEDGAYYTKNASEPAEHTAEDELLTKKDIKDLASKSEIPSTDALATKEELKGYVQRVLELNGNTSYMANESSGGIIKYTSKKGDVSKITLFDGSDENQTYAQVVAHDKDKTRIAKLNVQQDGIYYSKLNSAVTSNDEIVTKADLKKVEAGELIGLEDYVKKDDLATQLENYTKTIDLDNTYATDADVATKVDKVELEQYAKKEKFAEYVPITMVGDNGTSLVWQDKTGAMLKFTKSDGTTSGVCVNDGQKDIYAQLYAKDSTETQAIRLNVGLDGIYYTKNKTDAGEHTADDEIVTKGDLKNAEAGELPTLNEYVKKTELTTTLEEYATDEDLTKYVQIDLTGDKGTAKIFNEKDGGGAMFTTTDGVKSFVGVNDGTNDVNALLYVHNQDKSQYKKISANVDGIHYLKAQDEAISAENELVTKADITALNVGDLATKEEVALKADKTELEPLATKEEVALKADKTELNNYIVKDIKNAGNEAYMNNETTGPIMKFVKEDGSFGKITLTDATDSNKIYAQIVATTEDKSEIAKLNVSTTGIHYIKEDSNNLTEDNELLVRSDIKDLATKSEIPSIDNLATKDENALKADKTELNNYVEKEVQAEAGKAMIFNEADGGGICFNATSGARGAIMVNDGSFDGLYAQIMAKESEEGTHIRLNVNLDGIYYTKGTGEPNEHTPENEIATIADVNAVKIDTSLFATKDELEGYASDEDVLLKADKTELNNYVSKVIENTGNTAYINNETTGPVMKFTKADGSFGKITLVEDEKIYAQIVASKEDKSEIAKLDISTSGIHYIKEDNNVLTEDNEILTKADIKDTVKKVINTDGNVSYIANETTGAIMKYTKTDGSYGKITLVEDDKIYGQIVASTQDKSEIAKLDISTTGIHYIKEDNNTLTVDNELVVKKDVASTGGDVTAILNRLALLEDKIEGLQFQEATTVKMTEAYKDDKLTDYSVTGKTDKKTRLAAKSAMFKDVTVTGNNLVVETEEDTIINGATITGGTYQSGGEEHEPLLINAGGDVTIKNVTLAPEQGYNGLGVGMSEKGEPLKAAKNIVIDNVKITTKLANNGLNFYATADDSIITISNVEIEECSSPIRISNTNGKKCTVNIINCNFKKTEKGEWAGVICCEDGSSDTATADSTNRFGKDKLTINFQNVSVNGKTIAKTDNYGWGTDDRLVYVYRDSDSAILDYTANQDKYPTVNIL